MSSCASQIRSSEAFLLKCVYLPSWRGDLRGRTPQPRWLRCRLCMRVVIRPFTVSDACCNHCQKDRSGEGKEEARLYGSQHSGPRAGGGWQKGFRADLVAGGGEGGGEVRWRWVSKSTVNARSCSAVHPSSLPPLLSLCLSVSPFLCSLSGCAMDEFTGIVSMVSMCSCTSSVK